MNLPCSSKSEILPGYKLEGATRKRLKPIYLTIGLVFFLYISIRAVLVNATFDEILTIQGPVQLPFWDIVFKSVPLANNHIGNSLLIKALFQFGSDSLLLARIPNMLSFIVYAYFGYRMIYDNLPCFIGLGCFVLLISNPFLLDFFSLARGYGLALGFMMGASCFAIENLKKPSVIKLYNSLILGSLSVISLFSMVYFWLALAVVLNLIPFLKKERAVLKKNSLFTGLIGGILFAAIGVPVFHMIRAHAFQYGGDDNFYSDTLLSLSSYSMYSFEKKTLSYCVLNIFLLIFTLVASASLFSNRIPYSIRSLLLSLLSLCIIIVISSHCLAGVLYPVNRVALFFYPIFILSLFFCLGDLPKSLREGLTSLLILIFLVNFLSNANFFKTVLWSFEAHTVEMLEEINEQGRLKGRVVNLAAAPILLESMNYYFSRRDYPFLNIKLDYSKGLVPINADYYILLLKDPSSIHQDIYIDELVRPLDEYEKEVFIEYPDEGLLIFKNLKKGAL